MNRGPMDRRAFFYPAPLPFLLAASLMLASPPHVRGHPRPEAIITVGLRYDDCSANSPEDLEKRILAACARHRIPITFGVVPAVGLGDSHDPAAIGNLPLPPSRREMLSAARERGGLEIALHGYAHRVARRGERSEFSGVPANRQQEILAKGKAELEAFAGPVHTFIPPWNSYDSGTLTALAANGFSVLSADPAREADPSLGIRYVPATCLIPDLRQAVAAARASGGGMVIPYFHPYEIRESGSSRAFFSLAEFEAALAWLAAQPDVRTLTLGEMAALAEAEPRVYQRYARWARLAPPFLENRLRPAFRVYPYPAFPGTGGALWLRLSVASWYLLAILAGFAVVPYGSRFGSRFRKGLPGGRSQAGSAVALVGFLGLVSGIFLASFPGASLAASFFGLGLGIRRIRPHMEPRPQPRPTSALH